MRTIKISLFLLLLCCLIGCERLDLNNSLSSDRLSNSLSSNSLNGNLAEVATPKIIRELEASLAGYVPQVTIVTPNSEQTFSDSNVKVELEVEDFPLFRDGKTGLGNHLNLIVDNEPYQAIYSVEKPITIQNLAPGTHTIRAFAVRPWGESFKNERAYAQTTFNVLTETNNNRPAADKPLLTYNSPTGTYGAQPILLDFYLTNAPLHAIAQNNSELEDWRVRATIDGTSFTIEDWQPVYLTGLKSGENWVQLELIDDKGNNIENAFNNTVRVINYNSQQQDTLAKLVTDNIPLTEARSIVVQSYDADSVGVEPIVIDNTLADTPSQSESEPEIALSDNQEPTVSLAPATEDTEALNLEKLAEDLPQPTVSEPSEEIVEPRLEPEVAADSLTIDDSVEPEVAADSLIIDDSVEPEASGTITVVEADSEEEEATITIPQPESVEIAESEITIVVPPQPKENVEDSAPNQLQWWKKILVGLRRQIEALARKLPSEV